MNNNIRLFTEILEKIKVLPFNAETTIAELINYNPKINFVEPLIQEQIFNAVNDSCKKENIYIERNMDEKGGLAFYLKFRKYENVNNEKVISGIVNYIINMKDGEKNTIKNIFEYVINELNIEIDMDLFSVQKQVKNKCEGKNIILDYSAFDGQIVGVPYALEFVKRGMKKGDNINSEFKIQNYAFGDETTKIEFQKYLDEINEYNRKVANGEKPNVDLSEITSKFKEKFNIDELEDKKIEPYDIDGLVNRIDNELKSMDSNYDPQNIDKAIKDVDNELEKQ